MLFHSSLTPAHSSDLCYAYEQIPTTCLLLDLSGNIMFVNRAGIVELGYQSEQLISHSVYEFVPEQDRTRLQTLLDSALQGKADSCCECRLQLHGSMRWVNIQATRVERADGQDLFLLLCNDSNRQERTVGGMTDHQALEEKYRLILENISDLVMVVDRTGVLTYISPSHHTELGLDIELVIGQQAFANIHGDDLRDVQQKFLLMLEEKTPQQATFKHLHTNGVWMTCEAHGVPVLDETGEVVEIVVVSRDITVRQRGQEEIARLHRQYQTILDSAGEGIYRMDMEGKIIYCNPAVSKMTGYSINELIGVSPHQLFHRMKPDGSPFPFTECPIYTALREGSEYRELDDTFWRQDGTSFPVEYISTPVREDGEVVGNVVAFVDITERKKLERKRSNKEERIRKQHAAVLDLHQKLVHVPLEEALQRITKYVTETVKVDRVNIWTFAENRTKLHCLCSYDPVSDTYITGVQVSVAEYPAYLDALDQDRVIAVYNAMEDPRTAGWARDCMGVERVFSLLDAPIHFEGKSIGMLSLKCCKELHHWTFDEQHFASSIADLINIVLEKEERRKTEELLRKSEKLSVVGQLAAGVAHEIRNPLTSLRGFVQLLQEQPQAGKAEYYSIMLSELDRINLIVGEFLLIAKPQVEHFQQTPVSDLIQTVVTLIEPQAIMHNVQIQLEAEESALFIECDPDKLKQVFINVLKNSIEAMPHGGEIRIYAQRHGEQVWLRFVGQGGGIREERLPKLGEPFYTTKEKGTGLGLMVSYRIIEAHKGKITIESELGRGTTVHISLPLTMEEG